MGILNYTTDVAVSKTAGEIQGILARRGVTRISTLLDGDGNPFGLGFTLVTDYGVAEFELPVNVDGVFAAMSEDESIRKGLRTREQAAKAAWRIAKTWLEAQAALIDARLATMDQVMMPFMVDSKGRTAYEVLRTERLRMLDAAED